MTLRELKNHYSVKFLKGYGHSISVKNSKIILKDNHDPFSNGSTEEWYPDNMPYEKIVISGKGYISTEALSLLSYNNRNVILLDTYGKPITYLNPARESLTATNYRMAQYDTFCDESKGKWIKRKIIHKDAKLGFFRIRANIPDCKYVPPFPFRTNHDIIFPSGEFETYVTLAELQACEGMNFYRILEGYQFISESDIYPYRDFIENLYQKRMELKQQNNPLQLPIKIILNSIYGKTGPSVNYKIGNLFNSVIFAFITGFCRA
ncbi:MAG: CRISPR-associated endonuclease Cas1 [Nitrosopumilus sp.]|nr:CRISPR-associated endonuclease Cas1 [Nitrosopumilus sp.]MDH3487329.1 CRISPR-associated endonuclease Cas1 [Nitrosopumilus sp.]